MKKMKLSGEYLPQNVGRPNGSSDFDLRIGPHTWQFEKNTPTGTIWRTSYTNNIVSFFFALLFCVGIYVFYPHITFENLALWGKIGVGSILSG